MATVPVKAEYAVQNGSVKRLSGGRTFNAEIPKAVQIAVPMVETDKYPREVAVSGLKQSSGMTARTSLDFGKSESSKDNAFPLRPYI